MFSTFKRHIWRMLTGLLLLIALLLNTAGVYHIPLIDRLEEIAYDTRLRLLMPNTVDNRIVIVDLDEKSLKAEGRWPWGRDKVSRLLDRLFDDYGVAIVGFDVVFAEPDESSGLKVLQGLSQSRLKDVPEYQSALTDLAPQLDRDAWFAQHLKGRPVILGYYFTSRSGQQKAHVSGALPEPIFPPGALGDIRLQARSMDGYGANLPALQQAALDSGHFNPLHDPDGVNRRVPLLLEYQGGYYESLALLMARHFLGVEFVELGFPDEEAMAAGYSAIEWVKLGDIRIPVDKEFATLVPFRGGQGSFPYVSATDVLHKKVDPALLAGRIILIGTTAPGLMDLRTVPVGTVYPGVEVHASLISGILDNNLKERPAYVLGLELALIFCNGIAIILVLALLGPVASLLFTLAVLGANVGFNFWAWQNINLVYPIASVTVLILGLFAINMVYGFFFEARTKRRVAGLFGQYVPPELVEELSEHPEQASMEGDSREMTVLFSDVRNFTNLSEGLTPIELTRLMNAYLTTMTKVIHEHRGTIDKYIGDAIMAFWGAPLADPDHARHGLAAALAMQEKMKELREEFPKQGWPAMRIGVGLNSGVMNVGNMGSEFRRSYTVMGDAVNLASRLEGLTKEYGVEILAGEHTREALPDFVFRELDRVRVKGKDKPVAIFEPLGLKDKVSEAAQAEATEFKQALARYRAQDWAAAEAQLKALAERLPGHKLYELYLERIAHFRAEPPGEGWDGVFVFKTK
jgi:adenylate cyclase